MSRLAGAVIGSYDMTGAMYCGKVEPVPPGFAGVRRFLEAQTAESTAWVRFFHNQP